MARIPRLGEAVGIALVSLSFTLALALVSHTPGDPSFFAHAATEGAAHNIVGRAGATLSEACLQIFGLVSYFLVVVGAWLGLRRVLGKGGPGILATLVGFGGMLLGLLPLLHLALGQNLLGPGVDAGGILGAAIGDAMVSVMNRAGAIIFSLTVVLVCAVVSTQVSFPDVLKVLGGAAAAAARKGRTAFARFTERRRRDRMREQVVKKQARAQTLEVPAAVARPKPEAAPTPQPAKAPRLAAGAPPEPEPRPAPKQARLPMGPGERGFTLPPLSLLQAAPGSATVDDKALFAKAKKLTEKCREFGVDGSVIEIHPGPVVTTFEFKPDAGIKYSKVTSLADDLCLAMEAESVRIDRVSGKSTVGIEVPNDTRETIYMREMLESEKFQKSPSRLTLALGKTIDGEPYVADLGKMPHLLIAGATGAGKSVTLNSIIASVLFRQKEASPDGAETQCREVIACYQLAEHPLRSGTRLPGHRARRCVTRQRTENPVPGLIVLQICVGHRQECARFRRTLRLHRRDRCQFSRVPDRQRVQDQRVDHREDGGVRANP